jgi:hypothetical protein
MRRMGLGPIYQKTYKTASGHPSERNPCLIDLKLLKTLVHA